MNSIAHIGGTSKEDILQIPDILLMDKMAEQKDILKEEKDIFGTNAGPTSKFQLGVKLSGESAATLEAVQQHSEMLNNKYFRNQITMKYLKDFIDGTFRLKSFPNSNIIRYNYN